MVSYRIDTEEGQALGLELAGLGSRAAAGAVDLAMCVMVGFVLAFILLALSAIDPTYASDFALALLVGAGVALPALWQISFALRGRETPGKGSLGLTVIDRSGAPARLRQQVLRAMLLPIELFPLPLPIGLMVIFAHPESRRLGDLVAGTLVARKRDRPEGTWSLRRNRKRLDAEQLEAYTSELTPARMARLEAADRALLSDYAGRAGLRWAVRRDLESRLAAHFAGLFELPEPESPGAFLAALGKAL